MKRSKQQQPNARFAQFFLNFWPTDKSYSQKYLDFASETENGFHLSISVHKLAYDLFVLKKCNKWFFLRFLPFFLHPPIYFNFFSCLCFRPLDASLYLSPWEINFWPTRSPRTCPLQNPSRKPIELLNTRNSIRQYGFCLNLKLLSLELWNVIEIQMAHALEICLVMLIQDEANYKFICSSSEVTLHSSDY